MTERDSISPADSIWYILLLGAAAVVQTGFVAAIFHTPFVSIVPILVLAYATVRGHLSYRTLLGVGAVGGLFIDITSGLPLGTALIALSVAAGSMHLIHDQFLEANALTVFSLILAGTFVFVLVTAAWQIMLALLAGEDAASIAADLIAVRTLTGIATPPVVGTLLFSVTRVFR